MGNESINLWVRADMETYCPETLALIPENLREEYTRIMKQLAHAKGIAALALEQVHLAEQDRYDFFTFVQKKPAEIIQFPMAEIIYLEEYRGGTSPTC